MSVSIGKEGPSCVSIGKEGPSDYDDGYCEQCWQLPCKCSQPYEPTSDGTSTLCYNCNGTYYGQYCPCDERYAKKDNWQDRSSQMICQSCMFWVPKTETQGRCRRHAPTLAGWPVVYDTDWCGDHKLSSRW